MTAALNTSALPPWYPQGMFALVLSQEQGTTVPLHTVLEDPSGFEARVAADGFKTLEAWAGRHQTTERNAYLMSWVLEEPENEESVFSDESGEHDFSDDVTESGTFTDDGWESGSETDEDFDPDNISDGESSDSFIDESE
jgi:hypothetical protein